MKWLAAMVAITACGGRPSQGVPERAAVPEHEALGTLPETALPAISTEISEGMAGPETVVWDPDQDVYFVSNINGDPAADDDNGYIMKLSPSGAILDRSFVDGRQPDVTLHSPKGMVLGGDTLYVVDNGAVRLFDRYTGKPKGSWALPGTHFLNDLALDATGHVLVTETGIDLTPTGPVKTGPYTIYRFDAAGHASVLARGDDLHGPNGIETGPQGTFVVEFMDDEHGLYKLDPAGKKTLVAQLPFGELDGIALVPDGSILVSSWQGSGIYRVVPGEPPIEVVQHLTSPAGIAYDALRGRILIPEVLGNKVRIESWSPPGDKLLPMEMRF